MIVRGESTIIDYNAPFDQGFRLSFQKLLQMNIQKQYEKNVWEKSDDAYSLSIRVQSTINHIISILCFYVFFTTISTSKKMFSSRARAEKGIARHIDASCVVGT